MTAAINDSAPGRIKDRHRCFSPVVASLYGTLSAPVFGHHAANLRSPESRRLWVASFMMRAMSKIHIPTPLRQYVGKQSTVEVKAATVGEALTALLAQHPDLRRHLYTEDGKLRAFVNLYVNDEDIRYLQKEATAVKEGDNISIVPSIAGGAA
jgi:adenylyltransferase/sulfurtransferase